MKDTIPEKISEETFLAAIDVVQRYRKDFVWHPELILDKPDNNIIEFGAYLGHKTLHMAEQLA